MNHDADVPNSQDEFVALLRRFTDDIDNGMPEPARLRGLADDGRRRELVMRLLLALTPSIPEPGRWANWFDGGPSPRDLLETMQFAPGSDGSGRKIQNAAGNYEKAAKKTRDARAEVANAQKRLQDANELLAAAEEDQRIAAARAQGAILWALLREFSKRSDALFAAGPAWSLIRVINSPLTDEQAGQFDVDILPVVQQALEEQTAMMNRAMSQFIGDVSFERDLRLAIMEVCKKRLAIAEEDVGTAGAGETTLSDDQSQA